MARGRMELSWAKVIALLRVEGITAAAAPLPLTSMTDDVAALVPL